MMLYLFLGYAAVWTALFLYFVYLSSRTRALEREVAWLKDHVDHVEHGSGG